MADDDNCHTVRNQRSNSVQIVKRNRKKRNGDYEIVLRDQGRRKVQHTVLMKKTVPDTVGGRLKTLQLRPEPLFYKKRYRSSVEGRGVTNSDYKVKTSIANAMEQERTRTITLTTYKSVKCTCPDWAYRGVNHQRDRKTTKTEKGRTNGENGPILRAELGCKHMLKADKECAND